MNEMRHIVIIEHDEYMHANRKDKVEILRGFPNKPAAMDAIAARKESDGGEREGHYYHVAILTHCDAGKDV